MLVKTLISGGLILTLALTAPLSAARPATVLILPGLACPAETTTAITASLLKDQEAQVLDWTRETLTPQEEGAEAPDPLQIVLKTLDSLPAPAITLIGHSMGGWLALQAAINRPERVARLIILDAGPFPAGLYQDLTPEQALMAARQMGTLIGNMTQEQYQAFNTQRMQMMISDTAWRDKLLSALTPLPRKGIARLIAQMTASDLRPDLARIRASTLVLASSRMAARFGQTPDSLMSRLKRQYSGLEICSIHTTDQAGHFLMLEAPIWVQQEIHAFLETI